MRAQSTLVSLALAVALTAAPALTVAGTSPPAASRIVVAGGVVGNVRWSRGAVVELRGTVRLASGATLTIEPGARIEAAPGARLVVPRDSRIHARGTALEPIVLGCAPGAGAPFAGCWGGVVIHGFAPINVGQATSPAARGSGQSGCREQVDLYIGGLFGGCDDADSSGVLEYVRIEYAAEEGLRLAGVGSRTVLRHIQLNRGLTDGLAVVGGTANLSGIVFTANGGAGLHWSAGWTGRAQFLLMQVDLARAGATAAGILGENGPGASADNLPRSAPTIYNVSILGVPGVASQAIPALVLQAGTAATLRNVLVHNMPIGLDLRDNATCGTLAAADLTLAQSLFAAASGSGDADPMPCGPYGSPDVEAQWLADLANGNQVLTDAGQVQQLLNGPDHLITLDGRPTIMLAGATPPNDGFFDQQAAWIGALPTVMVDPSSIPWHAGWTAPAPVPAPTPAGSVAGLVASPQRWPWLAGVTITPQGGAPAVTSGSGRFTLPPLAAGPNALTASALPAGCQVPGPVPVYVPSGASRSYAILAVCGVTGAVADVTAGLEHTCAVSASGDPSCWGSNQYGQIGDGSGAMRTTPVPVAGTGFVAGIAMGLYHSCGLTAAGQAQCWGWNHYGQLGDGTTGPFSHKRLSPITVGGAGSFSQIALGAGHSCGLAADGSAWCWGENGAGQLGDGSAAVGHPRPTAPVSGGLAFVQLAAGLAHACGMTAGGQVWCWGGNGVGQIGDGTFGSNRPAPVPVAGGHVFTGITGGREHNCGLKANGEAWCWGYNVYGQLGSPGLVSNVPVLVGGAHTWASVEAGTYHTCGVDTAGAAWCWGANYAGQLGTGDSTDANTPQPVQGALAIARISAGGSHTCGVTTAGEVWCWGANTTGQLGVGSTAGSPSPVRVTMP